MNKNRVQITFFQLVLTILVFYGLVGTHDEMKGLYMILLLTNVVAIISSVAILKSFPNNLKKSIFMNLLAGGFYYFIGMYLEAQLTYELVEQMEVDANDPTSKVVTARLVSYGQLEFLLIYLVHALFAYVPYLDLKSPSRQSTLGVFSKELFSVRIGKKMYLIPFNEIEYIEASGNYIQVFKNGKKYTARLTLQEFSEKAGSN
ncbi:MAG: LytTR family transcriptional regulator, partial [Flavobacteriaceae bacterium]